MLGGYARVAIGGRHVLQHAIAGSSVRAQCSRSNARVRDETSGEEIPVNAACHAGDPAKPAGIGNASARFVADDDSSDDGSDIMAGDSGGSFVPVYGLFSGNAMIVPAINIQATVYPEETRSAAMFSGMYQSGAAPPGCGTNKNCQDAWLGGNGGGTAVALRLIGGELKQDAPECFGRPGIGSTWSVRVVRADETRSGFLRDFQDARIAARAHKRFRQRQGTPKGPANPAASREENFRTKKGSNAVNN